MLIDLRKVMENISKEYSSHQMRGKRATKQCTICKEEKRSTSFYIEGRNYPSSWCKMCSRKKKRESREKVNNETKSEKLF